MTSKLVELARLNDELANEEIEKAKIMLQMRRLKEKMDSVDNRINNLKDRRYAMIGYLAGDETDVETAPE